MRKGRDRMKKKIFLTIAVIVVLMLLMFICTGFRKRTDVVLFDYSVSEDGSEISLEIQVSSSMGYIKDKGGGVNPPYLTFYSTFGGLNSSFGSIHEIELELSRDNTEIYFNRPGGGYELVLMKDIATDEWIRPTN